jgi:hypothetical protein
MKRSVCAVLLFLMTVTLLLAQNSPAPPKPAPEMERVKYFLGTWNESGTMQPGPMGPGGKFTGTSHNEMGLGGFFMIAHSTFNATGMSGTGVAYMGYDANKKVYTYDEFSSMGEAEHSTGNVNDKTWTWTNENDMGGQKFTGRFTLVQTSATSYNMKYEYSTDGGGTWKLIMEGTGTKQASEGQSKKK